jgi:excisionase family DNA binding protein
MSKRLYSYGETAEILGVSVQTLRDWKMQGRLPGTVKLGHLVKFPEAYVRELETKGVPPLYARS